jgi:hypothetical protein
MRTRHYSFMFVALAIIASILIIGCGGGGSTNATPNTTASPSPTVDPVAQIKELVDGKATELTIKNDSTLSGYFAKTIEPLDFTIEEFDSAVAEMNKAWFGLDTEYTKNMIVLVPNPLKGKTTKKVATKNVLRLVAARTHNEPYPEPKKMYNSLMCEYQYVGKYTEGEIKWALYIVNKGKIPWAGYEKMPLEFFVYYPKAVR